jgi:hypothetical protein
MVRKLHDFSPSLSEDLRYVLILSAAPDMAFDSSCCRLSLLLRAGKLVTSPPPTDEQRLKVGEWK